MIGTKSFSIDALLACTEIVDGCQSSSVSAHDDKMVDTTEPDVEFRDDEEDDDNDVMAHEEGDQISSGNNEIEASPDDQGLRCCQYRRLCLASDVVGESSEPEVDRREESETEAEDDNDVDGCRQRQRPLRHVSSMMIEATSGPGRSAFHPTAALGGAVISGGLRSQQMMSSRLTSGRLEQHSLPMVCCRGWLHNIGSSSRSSGCDVWR